MIIDGIPVTVGGEPTGYLDVLGDFLNGNIAGVPEDTVVTVTLGLYGQTSLAYGINTTQTDIFGDFSVNFAYDIGPENFAMVDYQITPGVYQRSYIFPKNVFLLMQNSQISGYASGDVYAKVYTGTSDIKWQGKIQVSYPLGWFDFYLPWPWKIDPGDKVEVTFPGDITKELLYVASTNFTFSGNDTVSGNISLPNTPVRVSFVQWDGHSDFNYFEALPTVSDPNGDFIATFLDNEFRPNTTVDVAVMDSQGPAPT